MNNWTTGFFQDDLNVFYEEYFYVKKEHSKDIVWPYKTLKNLYVLFYVINGECELKYDDFKGTIKKNSLVLVRPQQLFQYTFKKDKQFEYLIIDIQPTVLKKQIGDKNFARAFDVFGNRNEIIDLNTSEFSLVKQLLDSVLLATTDSLGRCHVETKVLSTISELSIISDYKHDSDEENKPHKENVPVLIMDYIITHYTEKITYQLLADKFFTSPSTVAVIIKNFKDQTLKEYITELRMEDAKHMLKNGQISLYKIAEFCGYKEYSAFYKAYKKYFGVVPKANKPKKKRWPLSKQ